MPRVTGLLSRVERLLPVLASLAAIALVAVVAVLATGGEDAGPVPSNDAGSLRADPRHREQAEELTTGERPRPDPRREGRPGDEAPQEPPDGGQDALADDAERPQATAPEAGEAFEETVARQQELESFEEALASGGGGEDLTRRDRRFLRHQLEGSGEE